MQISELNKDLLSVLTGRSEDKNSGINAAAGNFSELLQSVQTGEGVESQKMAATDDYRRQTSSVEVKESVNADKRTSAPEKTNKPSEEKTSSPAKKEKDKKTSDNRNDSPVSSENKASPVSPKEKTPQSPVADSVSETVESENIAVATENIVVSLPVVPEMISDVVVDVAGEFELPVESAEIAVVVENGLAPESMTAEVAGVQVSGFESDVATGQLPADEGAESEKILADAGKEQQTTVLSSVAAEDEMPVEAVEKTAEAEIVRQEEKIAGMLPEEKAVEIKVSVKDDKITGFEDKKLVTPLVENVDADEIINESDSLMSAENGNIPTADKGTDLSKVTALPAANVAAADARVSAAAAGEKGEVFAVQALSSGETVRSSSAAGVKLSSGNNPADVRNEGLTREVAEQIKVNITRSAVKGVDKIEIQLKPADLGRLEIKMQIAKDGTLHAHIVASNAETLDILQKDLSTLKEAFNNAGYQTEDGSFSFGYHGEEQNNNEREQLRTFIGEVISRDVAEEMAANDYIGVDGVNIRV